MTSPYAQPTLADYNASPPSDDGSQVESNQLRWSNHITKIGDPLKTYATEIDAATKAAFAQVYDNRTDSDDDTDYNTIFTGLVDWNITGLGGSVVLASPLLLEGLSPRLRFIETGASAENGHWQIIATSEQLVFRLSNDAENLFGNFITLNRTSGSIDSIDFGGAIKLKQKAVAASDTVSSGQIYVKNTNPQGLVFRNDDGDEILLTGGGVSQFKFKDFDEFVTLNTNLQDDDDIHSIPLVADKYYTIEGSFQLTGSPGDFKYAFIFTNTPVNGHNGHVMTDDTDATYYDGGNKVIETNDVILIRDAGFGIAHISGHFHANASTGGTMPR